MVINSKKVIGIVLTVVISVGLYLLSSSVPKETISDTLNQIGIFGPIIFILLNTIVYIIAPLSNTPLLLAGFYLWGAEVVWFLGAAMFLSFITNYWIAKVWGVKIVRKLVGSENIGKVEKIIGKYDKPKIFLLLRIFQGTTHKFVSYAMGFTNNSFNRYILLSFIGLFPGMILWYILASKVNDPLSFLGITHALGLILPGIFLTGNIIRVIY